MPHSKACIDKVKDEMLPAAEGRFCFNLGCTFVRDDDPELWDKLYAPEGPSAT